MSALQLKTRRSGRHVVADQVKALIRAKGLKRGDLLPTYHEIAAQSDVAYMTVKRAMDVLDAEGLVQRIPSRGTFLARDLTPAPRDLVHLGVIFPSSRLQLFRSPYLVQIMQGVTEMTPPGSDMHIFSMREDGLVQAGQLGEWQVDGALLINVENDAYLHAFAGWGIPGVVVDYRPADAPLDFVSCDNRAAARGMVAHLAVQGHRRVVFAAVPDTDTLVVHSPHERGVALMLRNPSDMRERREESVRALQETGMLAAEIRSSAGLDRFAADVAPQVAALWSGPGPHPTAVMTNSSFHAVDLLRELEGHGLRAPQDFSFCTVAADTDLVHNGRAVTACRFDFVGMGRQAVKMLSERCRKPVTGKPREHRVGFKLVEGATTRGV